MIPQEVYERTQETYRQSGWPRRAEIGTWSSPWSGPDVAPNKTGGMCANYDPDAFVTGWGPSGMGITTLPVRR